tara:strand:+ start:105 stop:761 length:657 start_codon:yes stop_codon:yes gene_type:complete
MGQEFQRLSIDKAIRASQRCQRNWDLTQVINEDDVKVLETAVTQCASKQNDVYYKVKFITDRDTIESIHEQTKGFTMEADDGEIVNMSNSQTLANLLVVFCEDYDENYARSEELKKYFARGENIEELRYSTRETLERNRYCAVGVAAGYLNLTANMLGYRTGCCQCYNADGVNSILNGDKAVLLMGIGYPDRSRSRLEHHVEGRRFPSLNKAIKVDYI